MPKKSKEELLEKDIIDSKKSTKVKPSVVKGTAKKVMSKSATEKVATKKTATSSKSSSKKNATSQVATKKTATASKGSSKKNATSQVATKKTATASKSTTKKTATKNTVSSKKVTKRSSKKVAKKEKRIIHNKISKLSLKNFTKSLKLKDLPFVLEYYDLPYKYNKTVIKALAQNPNTLFVYWEISDEDVQNFKNKYGENFFYETRPVLIIHNLTDKYSFEVDINDFANNWYIYVNDTKCQYVVELGRRPKEETTYLSDNYLYVTSSNMIELPNDHVLFYDSNAYRKIKFKNIHTNKYTIKVIKPFLKNMYELYKSLYLDKENVSFDFKNPSSQNPTSNVF